MENSVSKQVHRYEEGSFKEESRYISTESQFIVEGPGFKRTYNCTLTDLEDLIYGSLFTSDLISHRTDIKGIEIGEGLAKIDLEKTGLSYQAGDKDYPSLVEILAAIQAYQDQVDYFDRTKAAHNCCFYKGQDLVYIRDDVGRHNAMDKLVGAIIREDRPAGDLIALTTGRLPLAMVEKLVKLGVPVAMTLAKPTDLALDLAQANDMVIIGEARQAGTMTVFTGMEMIRGIDG